jgi:hypothetical protein
MSVCKWGHVKKNGKCRECSLRRSSEWYKSHTDIARKRNSEWHKNHPERMNELRKKWRDSNSEKSAESTRKWQSSHKEQYKETGKRWKADNRERVNKRRREIYASDPERFRKTSLDWARRNPHKVIERKSLRRSRKIAAFVSPVTYQHFLLLMEAQNGCCRYCGIELDNKKHLDHRIPLARGGAHEPSNVCWSCPKCNQSKGARTEKEYIAFRDIEGI